ncbi:MAG TPA: FtsX-like permease family protein [Arachidicoccus sp.]
MNFLFAWRYFKAKKSTNVINIIAWISIIAIAVGSAALILVLSVFNGFEGLVKSMYGDFYSDLRVSAVQGKYIEPSAVQLQKLHQIKSVKNFSLTLEEKALLINGAYQSVVYLKGVDSNYRNVVSVYKHIVEDGKYDLGTKDDPSIVLGSGVANTIGAYSLSTQPLTIFFPNRNSNDFSNLQNATYSFNINESGVFKIQEDFDSKYAFTNTDFIRYMVDLPGNEYTAVELKIDSSTNAERVQKQVAAVFGKDCQVQTRFQQNQSLFSVMQMEKWIIYIILSIILVIAAFNMVGALTMLVLEKRKDIAVLKALGASSGFIQKIFLNEGFLLAGIGGVAGMFIAYVVCYVQQKYHLIKLEGGSFVVDYYPVTMRLSDFLMVGATIFVVAVFASWIPARKAAVKEFSLKGNE